MVRLAVVVAAVVALSPSAARAGACARPDIQHIALTKDGAELAKGGGVVVTTEDSAKPPKWQFTSGTQHAPAKVRVIGPGLVVLEPPAAGAWTLQDDKGKPVVKVKSAATDPKPLDAPKLKSLLFSSSTSRRGTSTGVSATLVGAAPAGAVALVIFDDKGTPRSFAALQGLPPSPMISVFSSGSCTVKPNGTVPSKLGDNVGVAWLDASGRLSAQTKITITPVAAKPGPNGPPGPGPGPD
jgi:hypothetical protein